MSLPMQILLAVVCFVAGVVFTGVVRVLPGFLPDVPNERSSHSGVIPRGGGLGFALPCLLAAAVLFGTSGTLFQPASLAFLVGGTAMLAIGLLDDALRLGVLPRLVGEVLVAGVVSAWGLPDRLPIVGSVVLQGPVLLALQAIAIVTAVNFFNFMDGIDALAAVQAIFCALAFSVFLSARVGQAAGLPPESAVALCLAGAVLGFLLWNLPPASVFMGDGGSYFLGFVLAWFALTVSGTSPETAASGTPGRYASPGLVAAVCVWFAFLLDPLVTLFERVLRGQNPFRAHREHLYQMLYHQGWSAGGVVALLLLANCLTVGSALASDILGGPLYGLLPFGALAFVAGGYGALRLRVGRDA